MIKVGIIGWRGLVGSVMVNRMIIKKDFNNFDSHFFSTSINKNINLKIKKKDIRVNNAYNIKKLSNMKIIITCQGSNYTKLIYKKLRNNNWKGYWIDSSSILRMKKKSTIVLDPVNEKQIKTSLTNGLLDYIGGNCTVSLMLMAIHSLIQNNWIDWISSMTYQAISGAGSRKLEEMISQIKLILRKNPNLLKNNSTIKNKTKNKFNNLEFKFKKIFELLNKSMLTNLTPWIDIELKHGQTKEEWKGFAETNKIMNLYGRKKIYIDGQCVRVGTLRSHSQALTIKLKKKVPLKDIQATIKNSNKWIKIIPNNEEETINKLNPIKSSETLDILVGRLRKLNLGHNYLSIFTIGDQLLWGAAEPIRRALNIILNYIS